MTSKSLNYLFYIRTFGVIGMFLMLALSEYHNMNIAFIALSAFYFAMAFVIKNRIGVFKRDIAHAYYLFADVTMLSVAIGLRGGLRSDFYLGYFLILGYAIFIRSQKLMIGLAIWMAATYTASVAIVTPHDDFSFNRIIIRMVLLIGTTFILSRYDSLLRETEAQYDNALADALHDQLTGVYNRRVLDYTKDILDVESNDYYVSIIDIDFFKEINDHYGHPFGDKVLQLLSKAILSSIANSGICIRYGGEEFLIIVKKYQTNDITQLLTKISKTFNTSLLNTLEDIKEISFTAGITEKTTDVEINESIMQADKALYYGKENGKNQIVFYHELPDSEK